MLDKMRAHKVQAPTNFCQKAIQGLKDKFHYCFSSLTSYTLECKMRGMGQTEVQNLSPKNSGVCDGSHTYFKTHPNFQHFCKPKCLTFVEKAQGLWKKAQAF